MYEMNQGFEQIEPYALLSGSTDPLEANLDHF